VIYNIPPKSKVHRTATYFSYYISGGI